MCFSTKKTSTTNATTGPEAWVRNEGRDIYGQAETLAAKPYEGYSGERVAKYNEDFGTARDLVNNMASSTNANYDKAGANYDAVAGADDPKKSVQDYMNPYLAAVLGPTIRRMMEQGQIARNQIGSQAAMSGAYGDARQGVLEGAQLRDENQNVGDTTAKLYAAGWDNATAARNAVLDRILRVGQSQQGLGTAEDTRTMSTASALTGLSDKEKAVRQAEDDAAKTEFERSQKYPYEQLTWLLQMLNQTPSLTNSTSTTTEKGTDNSGFQLLGKMLGTALAPLIP